MEKLIDRLSPYSPEKGKELQQRSTLSLAEKSVKYVLNIDSHISSTAYKVDGYLIDKRELERCDWLVLLNCNDSWGEVFVELKGSDIHHAVTQLRNTLENPLFKDTLRKFRLARIVSNKIPSNAGLSGIERAKQDFRRHYQCELRTVKPNNPEKTILKQFE